MHLLACIALFLSLFWLTLQILKILTMALCVSRSLYAKKVCTDQQSQSTSTFHSGADRCWRVKF